MKNELKNIIVQGYPGCFHEEAARKYFDEPIEITPANSFEELAEFLSKRGKNGLAIMAIENSIAGSLLQNYRILRENNFEIVGEVYLRIIHNLIVKPGTKHTSIQQVLSHPMAINQCLNFLHQYPHWSLVSTDDTALSALELAQSSDHHRAAIASTTAANLYDLEILEAGIETSKVNYTRFFIIQNKSQSSDKKLFDKASIYCRVLDKPGQLLRVLKVMEEYNINMSKLQSYPVLGTMGEYFFHIDMDFSHPEQYYQAIEKIKSLTTLVETLGTYQKSTL